MKRSERLTAGFFERDPETCARELIGCMFVWHGVKARIVETEAYAAVGDEACHTWFRPSARKFVAERPAGAAYVYLNYGVHWLFNVLVKGGAAEGFVLFRAVDGWDDARRGAGPGKLTKALGIDGTAHGAEFLGGRETGIFRREGNVEILAGPRVGISREIERPWRFGLAGSKGLSRRF